MSIVKELGFYKIIDEGNESEYVGKVVFIDQETKMCAVNIDGKLFTFDEYDHCIDSSLYCYYTIKEFLGEIIKND